MIALKNVNKIYDQKSIKENYALNDINLKIDHIGIVSIFGPSGCGKTTLLNLISGLDKATSGEVLIDGERPSDEFRLNNIGLVFQDFVLVERISVLDNLKMVDDDLCDEEIEAILKDLKINHLKERKVSRLSGGEKQRVSIARAILKKPKFIICDEPTGNLDKGNSKIVMDILKILSRKYLIIVVSHNEELVKEYSNRIIYMEDGKIVDDQIINQDNCEEVTVYDVDFKPKKVKLLNTLFNFKKKTNFIFVFLLMFVCILNFIFSSLATNNLKKLNYITDNYVRLKSTISEEEYYEFSEKYFFVNLHIPNIVNLFVEDNETFLGHDNYYSIDIECYPSLIKSYDQQDYNLILGEKISEINDIVMSEKLADYILKNAAIRKNLKIKYANIVNLQDLIGKKCGGFKIVGICEANAYTYFLNYDDILTTYLMNDYPGPYYPLSYFNKNHASDSSKLEKKDHVIYINKDYADFYDKENNLKAGETLFDEYYKYEVQDLEGFRAVVDDYLFYKIYQLNLIYSDDIKELESTLKAKNIEYENVYYQTNKENYDNARTLYFITFIIAFIAFGLILLFLSLDISELFNKDKDYIVTLRCLGVSKKYLIKHYYLQIIKKTMGSIIFGVFLGLVLGLFLQKFNIQMKTALVINPLTVMISYLLGVIIISLTVLLFISLKLRYEAAKLKQINTY